MKSPDMSPPRKGPVPNQDSTRTIKKQDLILPQILANYPTIFEPFLNDTHYSNKAEDKPNDSMDNSCTEINDFESTKCKKGRR